MKKKMTTILNNVTCHETRQEIIMKINCKRLKINKLNNYKGFFVSNYMYISTFFLTLSFLYGIIHNPFFELSIINFRDFEMVS